MVVKLEVACERRIVHDFWGRLVGFVVEMLELHVCWLELLCDCVGV